MIRQPGFNVVKTAQGHVNRITRFSASEGPGNRFVVYLQGCNFNCITCRNSERINTCNSCGQCVEPCPEMALYFDGRHKVVVDDDECTSCNVCLEACPSDSTPLSDTVRLDAITSQIAEVAHFISGITVSGGEPTMQADFVAGLFCAVKCDESFSRLTTFLSSNGHATREVWDRLLPVMDGALLDLKALDPETHFELTGESNELVLDSIRYLAEWDRLYEVRMLMVPGMNDDPASVEAAARWLRKVDPSLRVKLIGFQRDGVRPQYSTLRESDSDHMEMLAGIVRNVGFDDLIVA